MPIPQTIKQQKPTSTLDQQRKERENKTNMTRALAVPRNRTRMRLSKFLNRQVHSYTSKLHSVEGQTQEEMENRTRLRVQKGKPIKRSGRKLLPKLVDYFKSDTFMYAPLVSPLPSDFSSPDNNSAKVVELKKPIRQSHWTLEQVGEYLKSDVYMYAPLLDLPHSPQEPLQHCGMIRSDASTRRLTLKGNQRTDLIENVNQMTESHLPQTDFSDLHTWGQKETVKHTVYQSCRSTLASRNVTLNSQLRAQS